MDFLRLASAIVVPWLDLQAHGVVSFVAYAGSFLGFNVFVYLKNPKASPGLDRVSVSPHYIFFLLHRGVDLRRFYLARSSGNHSSNGTVCWSAQPVLYFLAAARFRFQFPLFMNCSISQVFEVWNSTLVGGYRGGSLLFPPFLIRFEAFLLTCSATQSTKRNLANSWL